MKRVRKSAITPKKLAAFIANRPTADWDDFKGKRGRYKEVAQQLRVDQHNLCAYCEIDLLESTDSATLDDFRVEHFHLKSPHKPPPNWALDWDNLLATCHGGSQKEVTGADGDLARFTPPDFCCDVPKGDYDWTAKILNPLTDIPAFPCLFEYAESSGKITVDQASCPPELRTKAQASIDLLQLNAPRLLRWRDDTLKELYEQIAALMQNGTDIDAARQAVAQAVFADQFPRFFTCVRWYLGMAAEVELQRLAYQG
jgi:uncharacterized protein (TIGR02646 family)